MKPNMTCIYTSSHLKSHRPNWRRQLEIKGKTEEQKNALPHRAAFQLPGEAKQRLFLRGEVDVYLHRWVRFPWVQLSQGATQRSHDWKEQIAMLASRLSLLSPHILLQWQAWPWCHAGEQDRGVWDWAEGHEQCLCSTHAGGFLQEQRLPNTPSIRVPTQSRIKPELWPANPWTDGAIPERTGDLSPVWGFWHPIHCAS